MTITYCCVYSVETPDDGQQICPKHVEFFIKINLRNSASFIKINLRNSASRWFYYKNLKLNWRSVHIPVYQISRLITNIMLSAALVSSGDDHHTG
jgi:hypothetical protein